MQKIKLDKKIIIYSSFYLLALIEVGLILPIQTKKFFQLNSQTAQLRKKISSYKQDINTEDRFVNDREQAKLTIGDLETQFVTSQDVSSITSYISTKAKENAVEILEIMPSQPQHYKTIPQGKFSYLPIKIEAKASFHDLAVFLNILSSGSWFLETKELIMKEDKPSCKVNFVVVVLLRE